MRVGDKRRLTIPPQMARPLTYRLKPCQAPRSAAWRACMPRPNLPLLFLSGGAQA